MVRFYGRLADESQMLDPGNPAHLVERAQRMARAAARDADPQRAALYQQAIRQASAYIPAPETSP
jgi:enoyl-CoA hydratase/carnithine racemase